MTRESEGETRHEVVVVEDETKLADLISRWVADRYEVSTAYSGEEALEYIGPTTDVVLLDRRMPGLSGGEVLGTIRERGYDCQVAMVSAVDPSPALLKLDIDEYLTKPVSRDEVMATVEELCNRTVLDDQLRAYLALVSKKETLEAEHSLSQLQRSDEYEDVTKVLREKRDTLTTTLADRATKETEPIERYSRREMFSTAFVLCLPAVVMIGIHLFFAETITAVFASGWPDSNVIVGYAASFVHTNDTHLYGNVVGYVLVALLTYFLSLRLLAARWFYVTSLVLVTTLPLVTAIVLYDVFDVFYTSDQIQFVGFSHVVSGFVGFSFVVFVTLLRLVYSSRSVVLAGGYIILQATSVIFLLGGTELGPAVGVACVLTIAGFVGERLRAYNQGTERGREIVENVGVLIVVGWLYTVTGLGLVPTTEFDAASGIVSHIFGLGFGFLLTILTALLLNIYPIRAELQREGYGLPRRIL